MGKKFTQEDRDRMASVGINREGYKNSTQTTRLGTTRRDGTRTEHFSGQVDVNVTPERVRLRARMTGDN
jgi:hypothetical protein